MNKIEPRLLKGFRDFGPKEQSFRQSSFAKIQNVFERFGFLPLSTPVLEYKDILMGKYGDDEKLVYSFKDNGDRDVAMRYDLTVPLARYVAQNQGQLFYPFKRYQIAPVWRADNPQKGRLREFYQCDVDVVGSDSALADADVIACLCKALESVGISEYRVRLNDRRNFDVFGENASDIIRAIDKVDKIGIEGVKQELESKKISSEQIDLVKGFLSSTKALQYTGILEALRNSVIAQGIDDKNIVIDVSIARGLDYYTSTVFEIVLPDKPEFGSICSGGRYDSLVDQFSKTSLPAVGGSIGIDRLFDAMSEMGLSSEDDTIQSIIVNQDESLQDDYVMLATELRNSGISTELYYEPAKLEKQFKYAESKGISFAVILGQEEKQSGTVKLKNLKTREQEDISKTELITKIKSL
jgi:histidyl-tRNA synthetase